jgi:uncharacterized membrane protein YeiH
MDPSAALLLAANPVASIVATAAQLAVSAAGATGTVASFVETTIPSVVASILPSGITTTSPNLIREVAITVPPAWELLAVFAGALSGGLAAVRERLDATGVVVLAIVTGLGGGIVRDVLLQRHGIAAFGDNRYLLTALLAALLVFFFSGAAKKLTKPFVYVDAISLGLFVVVGADKALRADMKILPAIMLGVITAVGGGLVRDLLLGEVPQILQPGALYSAAAVLGSSVFVLLVQWLDVVKPVAAAVAIAIAVALRLLALWRGWQAPVPRDYTASVMAWPRRFFRRGPAGDDADGADYVDPDVEADPVAGTKR